MTPSPTVDSPPDTGPRGGGRTWLVLLALAALVVGGFIWKSRQKAPPPAPAAPVERTTPWLENGVIRLPPAFAQREQLAFAEAAEITLTPDLAVTGSVDWDPRRVAAVGARIEGRIAALPHVEGESVREGELLAELHSVELGRAQAEVLKVRAREQLAKVEAERERKLADLKISPERDALFAQAHLEAQVTERQAAEKAVLALGGSLEGELGALRLRSPIAGRVVELKAKRGQTVSPTDTILVVADLRRVWVLLTVYERDIPAVRVGDSVTLRLPADPSTTFDGTVSHISEMIDADSRAGTVRVELDNTDGRFKPGLSVSGVVHASGPRERRLSVPREAITRIDGKPTVFVRAGVDAISPRPVVLGPEDAEDVAVLKGLSAGESVVTHGVLALKAEVFR